MPLRYSACRFWGVTSGCYKVCYNPCYKIMREKTVEQHLIDEWEKRTRGECIKLSPEHYKGIFDRLCNCWPGWTFYVEVKRPDGRQAPIQKIVRERWAARGNWCECLYTKEAVDNFIDRVCEHITNQTHTKTKG